MGRIRTGVVMVVAAAMMMASGCSDEIAEEGVAPATDPSPSAAAPESSPPEPETVAETRSPAELIAAGRGTYNANCISCHGMDPKQDGAIGPAVAGASAELIEARVMRAGYPPNYIPKRETKVMVPLPHLKAKLPEITAYLGSLK